MESTVIERKTHQVTQRIVDWEITPEGDHRSGNVRIVLKGYTMLGDYRCERWGVELLIEGEWRAAYAKGRPYGYGSPGQAKRGVSLWQNIILGDYPDPSPDGPCLVASGESSESISQQSDH